MLKDDPLIGKIFDFLARTGHSLPILNNSSSRNIP